MIIFWVLFSRYYYKTQNLVKWQSKWFFFTFFETSSVCWYNCLHFLSLSLCIIWMKGYLDKDELTAAANDAEYRTLRLKHWVKMDLSVFTPIIQEKKLSPNIHKVSYAMPWPKKVFILSLRGCNMTSKNLRSKILWKLEWNALVTATI